jgi:short-subunit dehydrogenase
VAPSRSLTGLKVLVTGASSGIGAAVSSGLAQRSARVFGTGRDGTVLDAAGGRFVATLARDLAEPGAPAAVVAAAVDALNGLDVVVSNAGAGWSGSFESMSPEELDWLLDINLRAPVHLAHAAAGPLHESVEGGQLVLIGSIAGLVGVPDEVAYAAAKAGLRGLAESLRAEWATCAGPCVEGTNGKPLSVNGKPLSVSGRPVSVSGRPVSVTLVSPGPVATPFFTRRNRPYTRSWPKPLPVEAVALTVIGAIERRQPDVIVPAWLTVPARLNGGFPSLYRLLSRIQG